MIGISEYLYMILIITIRFHAPKNVGLATGIKSLDHLEAEILQNSTFDDVIS